MNRRERWQWLFVNDVPFLCPERNIARQLQVETWLDLTVLLQALKGDRTFEAPKKAKLDYII